MATVIITRDRISKNHRTLRLEPLEERRLFDTYWKVADGFNNDFWQAANWNNGLPSNTNPAFINETPAAPIYLSADGPGNGIASLEVVANDFGAVEVELDLNGHELRIAGDLTVGENNNHVPSLTIVENSSNNGHLIVGGDTFIGRDITFGVLTIHGARVNFEGWVQVGSEGGWGSLVIDYGSDVVAEDQIRIGQDPGFGYGKSNGELNITGSMFETWSTTWATGGEGTFLGTNDFATWNAYGDIYLGGNGGNAGRIEVAIDFLSYLNVEGGIKVWERTWLRGGSTGKIYTTDGVSWNVDGYIDFDLGNVDNYTVYGYSIDGDIDLTGGFGFEVVLSYASANSIDVSGGNVWSGVTIGGSIADVELWIDDTLGHLPNTPYYLFVGAGQGEFDDYDFWTDLAETAIGGDLGYPMGIWMLGVNETGLFLMDWTGGGDLMAPGGNGGGAGMMMVTLGDDRLTLNESLTLLRWGAKSIRGARIENVGIQLEWLGDNVGVEIQRKAGDGSWLTVHVDQSGSGDWLDTNVKQGIAYQYRIRGLDSDADFTLLASSITA